MSPPQTVRRVGRAEAHGGGALGADRASGTARTPAPGHGPLTGRPASNRSRRERHGAGSGRCAGAVGREAARSAGSECGAGPGGSRSERRRRGRPPVSSSPRPSCASVTRQGTRAWRQGRHAKGRAGWSAGKGWQGKAPAAGGVFPRCSGRRARPVAGRACGAWNGSGSSGSRRCRTVGARPARSGFRRGRRVHARRLARMPGRMSRLVSAEGRAALRRDDRRRIAALPSGGVPPLRAGVLRVYQRPQRRRSLPRETGMRAGASDGMGRDDGRAGIGRQDGRDGCAGL